MVGQNRRVRIRASRQFIDLVKRGSNWPVWDPPSSKIEVGDYGTIDEESGLFKTHGNIFRNQLLPEAMAGNLPVRTDTPDDEVVVLHSGRKESELPPPVADKLGPAVYKAGFDFGGKVGAILAFHRVRRTSLPIAFDLDTVLSLKELTGMYLITSILKCPSYCIYLSNGDDGDVKLALRSGNSTDAYGESRTPWIFDYGGGFFRAGFSKDDEAFTVLFETREGPKPKKRLPFL